MALKHINILPSKALQNLPNLKFWFEKTPSGNPASLQEIRGFAKIPLKIHFRLERQKKSICDVFD
jgi:hypothetical protein